MPATTMVGGWRETDKNNYVLYLFCLIFILHHTPEMFHIHGSGQNYGGKNLSQLSQTYWLFPQIGSVHLRQGSSSFTCDSLFAALDTLSFQAGYPKWHFQAHVQQYYWKDSTYTISLKNQQSIFSPKIHLNCKNHVTYHSLPWNCYGNQVGIEQFIQRQ